MNIKALPYIVATSILLSPAVVAQQAETTEAEGEQRRLNTVTVSAEKRDENLQDVSISIQAVEGDTLVENAVVRLDDLDNLIPSVYIGDTIAGNVLFVRGVGTVQGNAGFEQSVATFSDGVYVGRARQSVAPLHDVARVEVLRGPQPVFFGQSAVAGALNIITRDGTGPFDANIDLTYASDNEVLIGGGLTIPFSDTFGIRLAARYTDRDGFVDNTFTGEDFGGVETEMFRATANWQATEALDFELKYETGSSVLNGIPTEIVGCDAANPLPNPGPPLPSFCALALAAFPDRVEYDYNLQTANGAAAGGTLPLTPLGSVPITNPEFYEQENPTDSDLIALTWNYDFGPATLTSVTAQSEYDYRGYLDVGGTPFADFQPVFTESYEQFSQELRIVSSEPVFDGFLGYMFGVYYQDADSEAGTEVLTSFGIAFGAPFEPLNGGIYLSDEKWTSLFASFTGNFSDTLRGTAGLRYSEIEKDGGNFVTSALSDSAGLVMPFAPVSADPIACDDDGNGDGFVQAVCERDVVEVDDLSYQLGIEWDYTDDVMFYATYTDAFKAGGLSQTARGIALRQGDFIYDDELVTSYELGAKSILLNGNLRLNASLFVSEFEDIQVQFLDPSTNSFRVGNAAEATSQGLEVDGEFAATDNLTITFSGSLLDAEYDSYPGAQCSQFEQALNGLDCYVGPPRPTDPDGNGSTIDRAGRELRSAPDYTINIGANYSMPILSNYEMTLSGNFNYTDDQELGAYDPRTTDEFGFGGVQSAYERIDLRAEFAHLNGDWAVALIGNNVTDETPLAEFGPSPWNGLDSAIAMGTRGAYYGIQLRANFGG